MTQDDNMNGTNDVIEDVKTVQSRLQQNVLWKGEEWLKTDALDFTAPEPEPPLPPPGT